MLDYYGKKPDLNPEPHAKAEKRGTPRGRDEADHRQSVELLMNLGKRNGLSPKILITLINRADREGKVDIGRINISQMQTYFNVPEGKAQGIIDSFIQRPCEYEGRTVSVIRAGEGDPVRREQKRAHRKGGADRPYETRPAHPGKEFKKRPRRSS